jgi:hypothetical protein
MAAASVRRAFFLLPAVYCDCMALNVLFRELRVQGIHAAECLCGAMESYLGSENPRTNQCLSQHMRQSCSIESPHFLSCNHN